MNITEQLIKEHIHYNPENGKLTWIAGKQRGKEISTLDSNGYIKTNLKGIQMYGHRIAFVCMTGSLPEGIVDHIDRNKSNNRWNNLRLVNRFGNTQNSKRSITNSTGVKGVSFCKQTNKYKAYLRANYISYYLGYYSTLEEAESIINLKRLELHGEFACNG